jgi:hypothetical protein
VLFVQPLVSVDAHGPAIIIYLFIPMRICSVLRLDSATDDFLCAVHSSMKLEFLPVKLSHFVQIFLS